MAGDQRPILERMLAVWARLVGKQQVRLTIVIVWVIVMSFAVWRAPQFMSHTTSRMIASKYTPSARAEAIAFSQYGEDVVAPNSLVVLTTCFGGHTCTCGAEIQKCEASKRLSDHVNDLVRRFESYDPSSFDIQSYFELESMPLIAQMFIGKERQSLIILITQRQSSYDEFTSYMVNGVRNLIAPNVLKDGLIVDITGMNAMFVDTTVAAATDMLHVDSIVLPCAVIVMGCFIGNFGLLSIPLLTVGISIATSFAIMDVVTEVLQVMSLTASIMSSLTIALSIDYSLFCLSRYRESIQEGNSIELSVKTVVSSSGRVVLLSGFTLCCSFLSLVFFPLLQSFGIGASVAIICTQLVCLTVTPVMLYAIGPYCTTFWSLSDLRKMCLFRSICKQSYSEPDQRLLEASLPLSAPDSPSIWLRVARWITKSKRNALIVVIVVLSITVPFGLQTLRLQTTMDTNLVFPSGSRSVRVYKQLQQHFPPGVMSPFRLLVSTNRTNGVFDDAFFDVLHHIYDRFTAAGLVSVNTIVESIANVLHMKISSASAQVLLVSQPDYAYMWSTVVNNENSSAFIIIASEFDPYARNSKQWVTDARTICADIQTESYAIYLLGSSVRVVDTIDMIMHDFPSVIAFTCAVVFVLLSLHFRSLLVPLRGLVTIGVSLSVVFGLIGVILMQDIRNSGLYWIVPVLTFAVCVGLTLDYDLFLLDRLHEIRLTGVSDVASIERAVDCTGSVVSGAGLIMALAFSGLIFSTEESLSQTGMILCASVLLDTFVIRTLLVPALLSLLGKWNWFPSKMPSERCSTPSQNVLAGCGQVA